ncbi:MAG: serine/threonine protein kinase [Alphaproteobacteria bacterium]|nr:serine/threonine protein kinase [Alphaproteobacteria bacterium]MCB9792749.1 serine/threonine protein kinase [Alphaproteobacteria bacterium]
MPSDTRYTPVGKSLKSKPIVSTTQAASGLAVLLLLLTLFVVMAFTGWGKFRDLAADRLSQSIRVLLETQGAGLEAWLDSRQGAAEVLAKDADPRTMGSRARLAGFDQWRLSQGASVAHETEAFPAAALAVEPDPEGSTVRLLSTAEGPLIVAICPVEGGGELRLVGSAEPLVELIGGPTRGKAPAEAFLYTADGSVLAAGAKGSALPDGTVLQPIAPNTRVSGELYPTTHMIEVKIPHEGVRGDPVLDGRVWLDAPKVGLLVQVREGDAYPLLDSGSQVVVAVIAGLVVLAAFLAGAVLINKVVERRVASVIAQLGQYQLIAPIGEGAMGTVWRASHAMLQRPTAVKLIRNEDADEEDIERFAREVKLTSRLTHPNTIAIYDFGRTPEGVFYYAMEYLPGITLEDLVAHVGALEPSRVIHLLRQAAGSLAEAHEAGLIHRDVKPANLMLCRRGGLHDVVKVLDFGLVKESTASESGLTQRGTILGTPHYMAPEAVVSPDGIDGRADLYSLAAVGYWLLTGTTLFEDGAPMDVCVQQVTRPPVPPSERRGSSVGADLEALLMKTLQKDPGLRPRNARLFIRALDECEGAFAWTQTAAGAWWEGPGAGLLPTGTVYTTLPPAAPG